MIPYQVDKMRRRLNTGRNVITELIETQLCQLLREPAAFVRTAQPSTSHQHASTLTAAAHSAWYRGWHKKNWPVAKYFPRQCSDTHKCGAIFNRNFIMNLLPSTRWTNCENRSAFDNVMAAIQLTHGGQRTDFLRHRLQAWQRTCYETTRQFLEKRCSNRNESLCINDISVIWHNLHNFHHQLLRFFDFVMISLLLFKPLSSAT